MLYSLSMRSFLPQRDHELVQIVDSALADAAHRSGKWLVCRPGCSQCCVGVFAINMLDAVRLREGLKKLEKLAPERATRVRERARDAVSRLSKDFPGDPATGLLHQDDEAARHFVSFADHEPCPALDPDTGLCDLYEARPMTCRVFGPPLRSEEGLGVCELCFHGATNEEIAACEISADPDDLESTLLQEIEKATGVHGQTIVAFCLVS